MEVCTNFALRSFVAAVQLGSDLRLAFNDYWKIATYDTTLNFSFNANFPGRNKTGQASLDLGDCLL